MATTGRRVQISLRPVTTSASNLLSTKTLHLAVMGLACAAAANYAAAAEWTRSGGLGLTTYYTSNVCRTPSDEEGEFVGTITPSVDLSAEGSRADFSLRAAAEYNSLAESDVECPQGGVGGDFNNRESWVPQLSYVGEIEAIENSIFLESNAFASQNAINPFIAGGDDNINGVGNTNITYRWGVGARLDRQFNQNWAALVRYNYNEQYNSFDQALGDSQEDLVQLDVGMIPEASRFSLGVRGSYSEVLFEETDFLPEFTNRLSRLELRAAFNLNRSWQINGFAGEEDNIFLSESDEIDGSYWDVGFRWSPNSRLVLDAGWGERFFGETPRFALNYSHKRSSLTASYLRDLQFPRNIRGESGAFDPEDPLGPGPAVPGSPLPGEGDPTFIGQRPVLNESLNIAYVFQARRTSFNLTASASEQTRTLDGGKGEFLRIGAGVERSLGGKTTGDLRLDYTDNSGDAFGEGDEVGPFQAREVWTFSMGLRRALAKSTSLVLRYRYSDQSSDGIGPGQAFNTFEEHLVSLSINFGFGGN